VVCCLFAFFALGTILFAAHKYFDQIIGGSSLAQQALDAQKEGERRQYILDQKNIIAAAERDQQIAEVNMRQRIVMNHAAPCVGANSRLNKAMEKKQRRKYSAGYMGKIWEREQARAVESTRAEGQQIGASTNEN